MTIKKITNQAELEAAINADFAKVTEESLLPFGEWKDTSIEDVPDHYLQWLLDEDTLIEGSVYHYLLKPIQAELKYRDTFDAHIRNY